MGEFPPSTFDEMENSIREDFSGTGMEWHREEQLDHVIGKLDQGSEISFKRKAKAHYRKLRDELL